MNSKQTTPPPIPPAPKPPAQPEDSVGMRMLIPVGRSGLAIAAGYLGLLSLVLIPAPIALIVSVIAFMDLRRSAKTEKPKRGMGRVVFGFLMGLAGTVVLLIAMAR